MHFSHCLQLQDNTFENLWSTVSVLIYLWLQVNLVSCLLKLPDLSDDVRNLKSRRSRMLNSDC